METSSTLRSSSEGCQHYPELIRRTTVQGRLWKTADRCIPNDLALLLHTHEQMQIKTAKVAAVSASVGLNIHKEKTKVLKYNAENSNPATLDGKTLEDVGSFTYLGSIIDEQGGPDADTKVGQQRLTSGELLLYSGHEEKKAPHTQGVALMLSKQAQNALIVWGSHGPRVIKVSFNTKKEGISMNVIQCYMPTNDYNEYAKDQFYNRLQSIVEKCPTKDLTILMEDFNAKVGTDNTGYGDIMGRHGLG
ncbi:unnamed protein product [Schistosoma margrebowiei]|uniref:Uncharacterized protein n=1 Tax=Schistosoma margrebowiei TaxID=48269 RepID=A0A183N0S6_9TREM|nr:unnamed protein product [Schistosoma margrebowiei]